MEASSPFMKHLTSVRCAQSNDAGQAPTRREPEPRLSASADRFETCRLVKERRARHGPFNGFNAAAISHRSAGFVRDTIWPIYGSKSLSSVDAECAYAARHRATGPPPSSLSRSTSLRLPPPVPGVEGLLGAAVLVVGQLPPGFDIQ